MVRPGGIGYVVLGEAVGNNVPRAAAEEASCAPVTGAP